MAVCEQNKGTSSPRQRGILEPPLDTGHAAHVVEVTVGSDCRHNSGAPGLRLGNQEGRVLGRIDGERFARYPIIHQVVVRVVDAVGHDVNVQAGEV